MSDRDRGKTPMFSGLDKAAFALVLGIVAFEGWLLLGPGARESEAGEDPGSTAVQEADSAGLSLLEAMGGDDTEGYARAVEPRTFDFPRDHAGHPEFRTEWWYVTNNLFAEDGRRFGVHFTIFRSALRPPLLAVSARSPAVGEAGPGESFDAAPGGDVWFANDVYMGHFALADVEGGTFAEAERFTRGAAGLAGSRPGGSSGAEGTETTAGDASTFRVWMDDWAMESIDASTSAPGGVFPLRLTARNPDAGTAIDIVVRPEKPMVLQGDRGLSQKGDEPGNASYYYSFTRLRTEGTVVSGGDTIPVTGQSWMDREWSTSALDETQEGWDWFALQLDDGRDLMVYRLRGVDGSTDPLSEGVLVAPDGTSTRLAASDFRLEVLEEWESEIDGAKYPSTWRVDVPSQGIALRVEPVLRDQEMNVTVRYWEGAVDLHDASPDGGATRAGARGDGTPIGRGYVELTGYAGMAPPGG
jgi:predicted secreted hydrolase